MSQNGEGGKMGEKGTRTKQAIRQKAYSLFAARGFQAVTMKDICEECKLSRGGLYRHYGSTRQIFEEILDDLSKNADDLLGARMCRNESAQAILKEELQKMQAEMQSSDTSLSYAIYEYSVLCDNHFMAELNQKAAERWQSFLEYGIRRGEFCQVDVRQMTDLILYVYQGVRMWSRVVPITEKTIRNIAGKLWSDLTGGKKW